LGNAQNLLGIHYMNTSRFTKAAWHFQLAVDTFKQIKDIFSYFICYPPSPRLSFPLSDLFDNFVHQPNTALIYCNIGKLMRVYAHNERMNTIATPSPATAPSSTPSSSSSTSLSHPVAPPSSMVDTGDDPLSEKELSHYNKAVGFYNSAKDALKDRKMYVFFSPLFSCFIFLLLFSFSFSFSFSFFSFLYFVFPIFESRFNFFLRHPAIWDAVHSQLASTYVVMGLRTSATHGTAPLAQDDAKQASEHLLRALKMYDILKDEYQAAVVHHHLATLYTKMIRYGGERGGNE
jgi:hypothetical protein